MQYLNKVKKTCQSYSSYNWDQTSLTIIPTGEWTIEKQGKKVIRVGHFDDKHQITGVFGAILACSYFPLQLINKGKTCQRWNIWHTENR